MPSPSVGIARWRSDLGEIPFISEPAPVLQKVRDLFSIADPHGFTLENGADHKQVDAGQPGFKRQADPFDPRNPGKTRSHIGAEAAWKP
jgi:hypothetical protein